jgi:hypothetical protein
VVLVPGPVPDSVTRHDAASNEVTSSSPSLLVNENLVTSTAAVDALCTTRAPAAVEAARDVAAASRLGDRFSEGDMSYWVLGSSSCCCCCCCCCCWSYRRHSPAAGSTTPRTAEAGAGRAAEGVAVFGAVGVFSRGVDGPAAAVGAEVGGPCKDGARTGMISMGDGEERLFPTPTPTPTPSGDPGPYRSPAACFP